MAKPETSILFHQLPDTVLLEIIRHSHESLEHLSLTCKALRQAACPEKIQLSFLGVKHGQQDLRLSSKLARDWAATKDLEVEVPYYEVYEAGADQCMQDFEAFFDDVAAALRYWTQLQSARVPFSLPLVSALVSTCQLRSLELTDSDFASDQIVPSMRHLTSCTSLRHLEVSLMSGPTVDDIYSEALVHLGKLTQLEDLVLELCHEDLALFATDDFDTVAVVGRALHKAAHAYTTLGNLQHLHKLHVSLECYSVEDADFLAPDPESFTLWGETFDPLCLKWCTQLRELTLNRCMMVASPPAMWQALCCLTKLQLCGVDLDDSTLATLSSCPQLKSLAVSDVCVCDKLSSFLPELLELTCYLYKPRMLLQSLAPKLRKLIVCRGGSCGWSGEFVRTLAHHPTLELLDSAGIGWLMGQAKDNTTPWSRHRSAEDITNVSHSDVTDSHNPTHEVPDACATLASLTSLTSLHLLMDYEESHQECMSRRVHAWAGSLRELHLTCWSKLHTMLQSYLATLLKHMTALRVLKLDMSHRADTSPTVTNAVVMALTTHSKDLLCLQRVCVSAGLFVENEFSDLPPFLMALVPAPRLALVQVYARCCEITGTVNWKEYRLIQQHVELMCAETSLPFHLEVLERAANGMYECT